MADTLSPPSAPLDQFKEELKLVAPLFECAAITFFAVKGKIGWLLVRAQIRILSTRVSTFAPVRIETPHFIAGAELIGQPDIEPTVGSVIKDGTLKITDLSLHLQGKPETFIIDYRGYRAALNSSWPRVFALTVFDNAPLDLFSLCGGRSNVDFDLRSLSAPYDGLEDLFAYLNLNLGGSDNQIRILVTGDVPIILDKDRSRLTSKELHIEVRAARGISREHVRVGYRQLPDSPTSRSSVTGEALKWDDRESPLRGTLDIPMDGVAAAHVFVSYRDQNFDKWWVSNPDRHLNFHLAAYEPFDANRTALRDGLVAATDRFADDLEHSVGILLSLAGYSVKQVGQMSRLREGPDLIAVTSRGEIIVVEATTTSVLDTKDKLSKLVSRTQQLKEHLAKSGWGHLPVQPLIVSSAPRSQLTDLDKAKANRIAVAAQEDTLALLQRLVVPQDPSEVFRAIVNLVPA